MDFHDRRHTPVFHDPERKRWRVVSRVAGMFGLVLGVLLGVTVLSVLVSPALPSLGLKPFSGLPQVSHLAIGPKAIGVGTRHTSPSVFETPSDATADREALVDGSPRTRLAGIGRSGEPYPSYASVLAADRASLSWDTLTPGDVPDVLPSVTATSVSGVADYRSKLIGFYVNWDDASLLSLKQHLSQFDLVIPEWLHIAGPGGTLSVDDPIQESVTLSYIRSHRRRLPVMPLVNNYDQAHQRWDSVDLARNLANPRTRARIAQKLLASVQGQHLQGINIDFENLQPSSRSGLVAFMRAVSALFHAHGLLVSQSVPASDPAYDYAHLAAASDFLAVMTYDQHSAGTDPGPVAAQAWFKQVVTQRAAQIPANKLVIGLGSYGYDWAKGQQTQPVTFEQALATAHSASATPALDPSSLNMHYDYLDAHGVAHHVWLLDAVSAFNEVVAARPVHPSGYAVWRLGSEDPTIWETMRNRDNLTPSVASQLKVLDFSQGVAYQGNGEILRVTGKPVMGHRTTVLDPARGLIVAESIQHYAQPYVITRWGGSSAKTVALTFDDGPDPQWTPQILDILDQNNVPATFFVIGMNADAQPTILKRELSIGMEIGNHTFTHPDIAAISPAEVQLQLDSTQRLFEAQLGIRSVLFRPPYGEDAQPDTPQQVAPLMQTGQMGYYTVGMNVDPSDWSRPGVQQIVDRTVAQVESGRGHVVLLHDGGGDRSETVAALPKIISRLRADGYRFVTVSGLVGLPRSAVMVPVPPGDRLFARFDLASFSLMDWTQITLYWLFMGGIVLGIGRLVFVGSLALVERVRDTAKRRMSLPQGYRPLTSVIVPAHNEEMVVVSAVEAVLASDYDNLEVIVVDDGSTDETLHVARDAFAGDPRVSVLTKANGGKAGALEHGIQRARGEIIIGMDADTMFMPDAIGRLVRHFSDPKVGAVAGNAKVGNRVNVLTKWQALEYITNQNLDRRAFDLLNCITVVPGAIGAWRRDVIVDVGGFTPDTLAEDADLTLRVLRAGAVVDYEDEAVALTEAPDTVSGLVKQRRRWVFGTMQTFWKHRGAFLRPSSGTLGTVAMPSVLLFQIGFQLISPVMDLVMALSVVDIFVSRYQHPLDWSPAAFEHILFYYALFLALDFATSAFAFALEPKGEDWGLLAWLFLQRFFYRQLMYFVVWGAVLSAAKGTIVGWSKIERKATVGAVADQGSPEPSS